MKIEIREPAVRALSEIAFREDEGIRILAEFVGTCAIATEIELSIEKAKEDDLIIEEKGFHFFVPNSSIESLPEEIILDYKNGMGYKISSRQETFGYTFKIGEHKR
ncbi:iron-sulfur cluster biosynthesis family protein [Oceanobacillus massiliensis]|uniref:iron-sulfur cluster biosynthesis family protein n=1 Tax=Oceanobacillus massiliensis TaxID=1465765 RepID=UPI0030184267